MTLAKIAYAAAVLGLAAAVSLSSARAQALDKVTFGTNWVAEAEHGGFYQAVADGTYEKYGLDVTIVPGGPQANNRMLLPAGKIDFYMGGNMLQALRRRRAERPDGRGRGHLPEGPAGAAWPTRTRASRSSRT